LSFIIEEDDDCEMIFIPISSNIFLLVN